MSRVTKVKSHIVGVRKKADSPKRVGEAKSSGNPALVDFKLLCFDFHAKLKNKTVVINIIEELVV